MGGGDRIDERGGGGNGGQGRRNGLLLAVAAALFAMAGAILIWLGPWRGEHGDDGAVQIAAGAGSQGPVSREQAAAERRARQARLEAERAEQQRAKAQAEQEELEDLLASPARWRVLPAAVRAVRIDRAGRAWFHMRDDSGSDEVLRRSVERAVDAKVAIIRGGRLLLADRAGRVWICPDRAKNRLLCYSTSTRTWLAERLATGDQSIPASAPTAESYRGLFTDVACEDTSANVYFVGGASNRGGYGIHRLDSRGKWSFRPIVGERTPDHYLLDKPIVLEQPGGRIAICPRRPSGQQAGKCRALYFDGKEWEEIDPRVCRNEQHTIQAMVPLPNGAIGTLCEDRFWVYWPEGTLKLQGSIEELLGKLSDPDAGVREAASEALIALGPQALSRLEAVADQPLAPEEQVRLEAIIETLKAAGSGQSSGAAGLHGGRYAFEQCYFTSRGPRGQVRLYVEHCRDIRLNRMYHESFVTLDSEGTWNATVIPSRQWRREGLLKLPVDRFEDSKGGVWLQGGLRTSPADNALEPVAPDGLRFGDALGEDGAGRIYFDGIRGSEIIVFDPAVTEREPGLWHETFQGAKLALLRGEAIAWAGDCWNWPNTLLCVGSKGQVLPMERTWEDAGISYAIPLRSGAVIVGLYTSVDRWIENPERLWDGAAWQVAENLPALVHKQARALAKLAGDQFEGYGPYPDLRPTRLAADGKGSLWFATHGYEYTEAAKDALGQEYRDRLEYFDGSAWHDAWKESGLGPAANGSRMEAVTAVEGGAAVLVADRNRKLLWRVGFDPEARGVRARQLAMDLGPSYGDPAEVHVIRAGPEAYLMSGEGGRLLHYTEGDVEAVAPEDAGVPVLCDSSGRFWFVSLQRPLLRVAGRAGTGTVELAGISRSSRMVQSADGRLWLLHDEGISQIGVEEPAEGGAGGGIGLREKSRHPWNAPKNTFEDVFCDANGGLWFRGTGNRLSRFQLPPK